MTEKLKVGDRVVVNNRDEWCHGMEGTVVETASMMQRVDFGAQAKGWGHDGSPNSGNTWWLLNRELTLVPAKPEPELSIGVADLAQVGKLAPQPAKILAHMLKGKSITHAESMLTYHISRLSDCILKIRRAGYEVVTENKVDEVGGKYARYHLAAKAT